MNYNISDTKNLIGVKKISDFPAIDSINNSDLILIEREGQFYNSTFSKLAQAIQSWKLVVGDTTSVDGIDVLIIAALKDGTWVSDIGTEGTQYIAVDKNHDLIYYVKGNDYVNGASDYDQYGYEWGGFKTETSIQDTAIGTGLTNTNSLIGMNLQPYFEGNRVVWSGVTEFRQSHSDKWFVPSKDELNLIYQNRVSFSNLSTVYGVTYWSSSEYPTSTNSGRQAWRQYLNTGKQEYGNKNLYSMRVRLCCLL